ncbi:unnamed protein product [Enterobius vermicularis]|uniref:Protein LTV1 homolog n=1 Tax=Enterobius vermicularis TaxID=51028 RepID=A0A3P6J6A7_ENTVE|nr:unnamed protein product [Enterobius vermicularis]
MSYITDDDGEFDPEIEAALRGEFDFDNPNNELEDDFVLSANDGVLPLKRDEEESTGTDEAKSVDNNEVEMSEGNDGTHNDQVAKRFAEECDDDSEEQLDLVTVECSGPKKAKWDCESILSTYSDIYNKPFLIQEPRRKQKLKEFLRKAEVSSSDTFFCRLQDYEMEEVRSKTGFSLPRPKDEGREEKRARKALVKEQRRERRIEKKCNKLAFKEEKKRIQGQQHGTNIKTKTIV